MDLHALERQARDVLTVSAYDYFAGGADDEVTLADNLAAWDRLRLRPRVLRDVTAVRTATTVMGAPVSAPILVAPTACHGLAHVEGERATARGAAAAGSVMVVSTLATTAAEDVAAAGGGAPQWFQLYVRTDRDWAADLVRRVAVAGYRALVLTVDVPVLGHRPRDVRNNFALPEHLEQPNIPDELPTGAAGSSLEQYTRDQFAAGLTFDDVGWLGELCDLPVLVKGVLRGDDASAAVAAGATGVIVSNHGGRQLDSVVAATDALPEVVDAVGDRAEVYVDGGVRRGTDVLKALALGARAVLLGRPVLWGLAVGGADGVAAVLDGLAEDLRRAMMLAGAATLADVTPDLVVGSA